MASGIPDLMARVLAVMYESLLASNTTLKPLVKAVGDRKGDKTHPLNASPFDGLPVTLLVSRGFTILQSPKDLSLRSIVVETTKTAMLGWQKTAAPNASPLTYQTNENTRKRQAENFDLDTRVHMSTLLSH
jgi:hypothetical protein